MSVAPAYNTPEVRTGLPALLQTKIQALPLVRAVRRRLDPVLLRPFSAAIPLFFTVLAGLVAGAYAQEILSAWPVPWRGPVSIPAVTFWSFAFGAFFLYWYRQSLIDLNRHRVTVGFHVRADRLRKTTQRLERLMQTMPPKDFLEFHNDIKAKADTILRIVRLAEQEKQLTPDKLCESIRAVLNLIATLAHAFDDRPGNSVYCANLMIYRPTGKIPEAERTALTAELRFCEYETHISRLRGVLYLDLRFSAATDVEGGGPDPRLQRVVLPIPETKHEKGLNGKNKYLPGAPAAFIRAKLETYADTQTLGAFCREHCDFSAQVIDQLEAYFKPAPTGLGRYIGSFASMPVRRPGELEPWAVLNIHRDSQGVLRDREAPQQFFLLNRSFETSLSELFDLLQTKEA